MKLRKLYVGQSFAAIIAVGCLLGPIQASASVSLSLSGQGAPSVYGFGAKGLYLGGNFSSNLNHPYTNWTWSDLEMTIQSDGDATINGTMTRDYNSEVWGVNIQLDDIEFRKTSGSYKDGQNWSGSVDQQTFLDLAEGINPFNGMDQSSSQDWGFEWKNLSMSLDKMGNTSSVPEEGWEGFAMPDIGHALVAELHYDGAKGLTFESWYKNPDTYSWYDVGDTKALATVNSSDVPEPTSLLLLSLGLFGIGTTKFRKKA